MLRDASDAEFGTVQYSANLIWATLHIQEMLERGWIKGGFEVITDNAWASLRTMIITDHVVQPSAEFTRRKAVSLMMSKPGLALDPNDMWIVYDLLGKVAIDWPDKVTA